MVKILNPNGKLIACGKVVPCCEILFTFNGNKKFISEVANGWEVKPTGILIESQEYMPMGGTLLYIGNLPTKKVKEIMKKLLIDGYYDFSELKYQNVKTVEQLKFDNGEGLPYTNEITFIPNVWNISGPNMFCDGLNFSSVLHDEDNDEDCEEGED